MKILHKYILRQMLFYSSVTSAIFTLLFIIFDFFDRIDNIVNEDASIGTIISYFVYKIPSTLILVLPISIMSAVLLTVGLLSKSSELTAMRAGGSSIFWLTKPILIFSFLASLLTLLLNETLVPYSTKKVKDIYNIQIKKKDSRGSYSQSNFWWRSDRNFFSFTKFDSSSNSIDGFTEIQLDDNFSIAKRSESKKLIFVDPILGWVKKDITNYTFTPSYSVDNLKTLPLPLKKTPHDFYDVETEVDSLSFSALKRFIKNQKKNGTEVIQYLPEMYAKLSFPFVSLLIALVIIPFSMLPARSGSIAKSVSLSIVVGFTYYVIHSLSVALGQAEILPPILSACCANILLGIAGIILMLGVDSPS